jgi:hypothetical protein
VDFQELAEDKLYRKLDKLHEHRLAIGTALACGSGICPDLIRRSFCSRERGVPENRGPAPEERAPCKLMRVSFSRRSVTWPKKTAINPASYLRFIRVNTCRLTVCEAVVISAEKRLDGGGGNRAGYSLSDAHFVPIVCEFLAAIQANYIGSSTDCAGSGRFPLRRYRERGAPVGTAEDGVENGLKHFAPFPSC